MGQVGQVGLGCGDDQLRVVCVVSPKPKAEIGKRRNDLWEERKIYAYGYIQYTVTYIDR